MEKGKFKKFWLRAALLGIAVTFIAATGPAHAAEYATTQLTSNAYADWEPQINDSGQVVWYEWDGTDYEIFLYDGTTTIQLTNNSSDDTSARINASGQVV